MIKIKIEISKTQVYFTPEGDEETAKLTALWRLLIDCVKDTRKLVPVGDFFPEKNSNRAAFHIEGLELEEGSFVEVKAKHDLQVYCKTCNKLLNLKAGEVIPICCGKMMEIVD